MSFYVKNKNRKIVYFILMIAMAGGMLMGWWNSSRPVFAQSIRQIPLTISLFDADNKIITNGSYEVRFGIYSVNRTVSDSYPSNLDAGNRLWEESQRVEVKNGVLRVFLGDATPFPSSLNFNQGEYFLGVRIGTDSEMIPRKRLGSVPSALNAVNSLNSESIQGLVPGTQSGNLLVLSGKGLIDLKQLPTGGGTKQLVLGDDARLHDQNTDTGTDSKIFTIGDGLGLGNDFDVRVSDSTSGPALRYSGSTGTWQISNDGITFSSIATSAVGSSLPLAGGTMTGNIVFAPTQLFTNLINLGADTVGNYVATLSGGNGISVSGSGAESATPVISLNLLSSVDGTGLTSSASGFEFAGAGADQLALLQGCANGQGFAWNDASNLWECANFAAGLTGTGTPGYVAYWGGPSSLGSEQYLDTSRGGTGLSGSSAANGTLLIGNGTGYTLATLTQGNGVSITNASGNITLAVSSSVPTSVTNDTNVTGSIVGNTLTLGWAGQLVVSRGGTGAATFTSNGVLYGNGAGAIQATAAGTSAQFLVANGSGVPVFVSMSSDVLISNAGVATIQANAVALGTDTTGNYVATVSTSALTGITGGAAGSEGTAITLGFDYSATIAANPALATGNAVFGTTGLIFEGATADAFEGLLTVTDPTADNTWTLPNVSGTVITTGNLTSITATGTITSGTWNGTAIGAQYGGTGINTSASTGVPTISAGTWSVAATLGVAQGGTNIASYTIGDIIYASGATTLSKLADVATGNVLISGGVGVAPSYGKVALGTHTTGDYVSSATASGGLTMTGTAGASLGILLPAATDALSSTTSSGSGLELLASGLTLLQGCANNEVLSWNETTDVWACSSVSGVGGVTGTGTNNYVTYWTGTSTIAGEAQLATSRGGTGINTSASTGVPTISSGTWSVAATLGVAQGGTGAATFTTNGVLYGNGAGAIQATAAGTSAQFLVANGSGVPVFVSMSSDVLISNAGVATIQANAVALGTDTTGNYVATVSTSALTGITGGAAGSEGTAITLGFDYSATIAANPALATGNAVFGTNGLIFEGATADTFEGLLTVTDPTADNTWTLPNVSGTVITTGNLTSITATGTITSGTWNGTAIGAQYGGTGINTSASTGVPTISSGTWSVAATLGVAQGGTGAATFTTNGVLYGNGAGAIQATAAGTSAQFLVANGSGVPVFVSMSSDVLISNAGVATIQANAVALGTDTTGNYVATVSTSALTGITGGAAGSEGTAITLGFDYSATIAANPALATGNAVFGTTGLIFEGATADAFEGLLTVTDPTADNTWTLPNVSGTVITTGNLTSITATGTITSGTWNGTAIGAQYGGTGINTSASTGVPTISSGTWSVAATLGVAQGGTGIASYTIGDIIYASGATTLSKLADVATGNVLISGGVGAAPSYGKVALGTHTTGDYVSSATANGGLTMTGTAGASLGILLPAATDALSSTTSSGSGLELLASGLTLLQGCANNEVLSWNETTDVWACSSVSGVGGVTGTGTNNYVTYWTGTSTIAGEAQLATSRGGTGINTSASTGVPTISSGTWSVAATLGVAQGGTGAATFTSNGVLYGNGAGAIQATAAGTSAQFLVANGSGVPVFVSMSSDVLITNAGVATIQADAVALGTDTTGNYVATVSTSALTGITGGAAGSEGTAITLGFDYSATLAANPGLATGNAVFGTTGLIFEGATADTFEGLLTVTDPTADNTWTLPNVSGTVITTGNLTSITATGTITSGTWNGTAIGAQYGGTGINTSASTGVPTISSGTWSVAATLGVAQGGTGIASYTIGDIIYASGATTLSKLADVATGNVLISGGVGAAPSYGKVALGTHTTGDYVSSATANGGLTMTGTAGASLGILLPAATDALSSTTSSGSGLELLASGLTLLQGCANNEVLSWNETTDVWACSSVSGVGGVTGTGTNNYVTYWTGTSTIAGEAQLATSRGGTGINTSASTGVPTISSGTWSVAATLGVAQGGTGAATFTSNGVLYGNGAGAIQATAAGTSAQFLVANGSGVPVFVSMSSDVLITNAGVATIQADAVALGTDTTGNYVATVSTSALTGITGGAAGSEGTAITLGFDYSATLAANPGLATGNAVFSTTGLIFEGATADTFEGLLTVTDPTADNTWTLPNVSGTVITTGNLTSITATGTITSGTWNGTAIGAQYGGTGINTSASTGVPTISSGTWSVAATLGVAQGGTGIASYTIGDIIYASGATTLSKLADVATGNVLISGGVGAAPSYGKVALGTHTTGDYVSSATANGGLTMTGTAGASLGILLPAATDALSSTTSSGSGLELLASGLTLLQGCANNEVLSWNETTDVWACSSVSGVGGVTGTGTNNYVTYWTGTSTIAGEAQLATSRGGTGINTSASTGVPTISSGTWSVAATLGVAQGGTGAATFTSNGVLYGNGAGAIQATAAGTSAQFLVANGSGVPVFVSMSSDVLITNAGVATIQADAVALGTDTTGNYVATVSTSALTGITGGAAGSEGTAITLGFDYSATLAANPGLATGNAVFGTTGLIFEGATADTFEGLLTVTDPTADNTWTLPNVSGTVITTGNLTSITATGTITSGTWNGTAIGAQYGGTGINTSASTGVPTISSGTWSVAATLGVAQGGTGIASYTIGDIIYASGATTLSKLADVATGNVLISGGVGAAPSYGKVALGTHTTGDYVSSATANGGLTMTGTAGASLGILLPAATDALSSTTSSGSGLELLASGLTLLQGCANNEVLSWNETTDVWACSSVSGVGGVTGTGTNNYVTYWTGTSTIAGEAQLATSRGGTGINTSASTGVPTISSGTWSVAATLGVAQGGTGAATFTSNGVLYGNGAGAIQATAAGTSAQFLVANGSGVPVFVSMSSDVLITNAGVATIQADAVALGTDTTGNYVATVSTSALTGITGGAAGSEGTAITLGFDYSATLAANPGLATGNAVFGTTGLIFEGATADTFEGLLTVTDPTADNTWTLPNVSGTVITTGNLTSITATGTITSGTWNGTAIGAQYGGTGINTSASTGVPTISSGTWSVAATLGVAQGGTGIASYTIGDIIYASGATTLSKLADVATGNVLISGGVGAAPSYGKVALGTHTTGDYVSSATANGGLTMTGTAGASLGILLPAATDALSSTTSSGSGLELLASGLTLLQGCANNEVLSWNETTDVWACSSVIAADSLDFTEFKDAMTLDASANIAVTGSNVFSITNSGTGNSLVVNDQSGDTTPFVIDASGNVGIGVATPSVHLDVASGDSTVAGTANLGARILNTSNSTGVGAGIGFTVSSDTTNIGAKIVHIRTGGNDVGDLAFYTKSNELAGDYATERMRITSTGNVGIGDTTPDAPLEVLSTTSPQLLLSYTDGSIDGTIGIDSNEYLSLQAGTSSETKRIQIGAGGAGSTTPDFFGLDVKSDTGDPAGGFEGAMYYNTFDNKFRCYQGSAWMDCVTASSGMAIGGTITSATQGSVLFAGASGILQQDNASFFWDDTNNRLGLGTTSPAAMLSLYGASNAFRLSYDGSNYNTVSTTSTGEFLVSSSNTSESQILVGSGSAVDTSVAFDGSSNDYFSGVDNTTGSYMIGSGFIVQSGNAFLTITSGGLIGINMTPVARFDVTHSSTSTIGAIEYSERNTFSDTGVVTTGTDTIYGDYVSVTRTGATGGTINSYGQYVTLVTDNAGSGISTAYGSYIDTGVAGSTNADIVYGQYINTESNAGTAYGLYVDAGTGAGTEYAGIFMNGNVGIGTASPTGRLHSYVSNSAVTATTYNGYFESLATNTTTDAINKSSLYIVSTGSFTGSSGTATNNYGIYIATTSGGDNNYQIYDQSGAYLTTGGTWTNAPSYRRYKENFTDTSSYLDRLMTLDINEWQYKNEVIDGLNRYTDDQNRHASPFLDDFYATFMLGSPNGLNVQDFAGVALASVKELNTRFINQNIENTGKLAELHLATDANATTLGALQTSVDSQLVTISGEINAIKTNDMAQGSAITTAQVDITNLRTDVNTLATRTTALETSLSTMQEQLDTLTEFFAAFDVSNVITKDVNGNVYLLDGKLAAQVIETGGVVVVNAIADAPTIGTTVVYPVAQDDDADGNDDYTDLSMTDPVVVARDGKYAEVLTKAMIPMINGSRIFTSFKGNPGAFSWVDKTIDAHGDYIGFKIRLDNPVTTPIKVDWWLIEQK